MPSRPCLFRKRQKNSAIRLEISPVPLIRVPNSESLNLPPRACCIRLRTRWKRLGYVRSSHSQKTGPTVRGRRKRVYSAPAAPASFEAARTVGTSLSFKPGMIGAISTRTGIPASARTLIARSLADGVLVRGSIERASSASRVVMLRVTWTRFCEAKCRSKSRSRSTKAFLVMMIIGCWNSAATSRHRRVSWNWRSAG